MYVQVTNPIEIAAVKAGEIEGDEYNDGEVYADEDDLEAWRREHGVESAK